MHILFAVTDFDMGGITTSLKNFSSELIRRGNKVSILNLPNASSDIGFDKNIDIISLTGKARYWNIGIIDYKNAKGIKKLKLLLFGICKKLLTKLGVWEKFIFSGLSTIKCDVAVAYRQSPICYYICKDKTTANKTIAFIHCEFNGDCSSWLPALKNMDYIACVSNDWCTQFKESFPNLSDKVYTVYNLFDSKRLKNMAKEYIPFEMQSKSLKIVTSARIDFGPKRLDLIPDICSKLISDGVDDFKWYIVGDGQDRHKLEEKITKTGMEKYIMLVGTKNNPYPYIKNADLFVLISDWESYGMVIQEAMILATPILASKYPALYEIMEDNVHGIITEKDTDSIANGIEKLYRDKALYLKLKNNCMNYTYSSDTAYNQFMKLCK